jgi:glutamate carboxypeptidase
MDFGALCRQYFGDDALAVLVFEGGYRQGEEFKLVVARKGMARYRIEVDGRSAHAGTSIDEGASAIVQLAEIIQRVSALRDGEQELSVNIGSIEGGTVSNRVPHFAAADGELRAFSTAVFDKAMADLRRMEQVSTVKSIQNGYACRVRVIVFDEWKAWSRNAGSDGLLALWQEAVAELTAVDPRTTIVPQERGGLSDGNYTWQIAPTIDGLGPAGGNAHCAERNADRSKEQEYVAIDSFIPKATINIAAIVKLIERAR